MASADSSPRASTPLTDYDKAILAFEREWWQHPGSKDEAIRVAFDISPARFYQVLMALVDSRAALEYDPMLIKRLQRVREQRRQSRAVRLHPSNQKERD
jgi:Protein of unknown function (DUF3263)